MEHMESEHQIKTQTTARSQIGLEWLYCPGQWQGGNWKTTLIERFAAWLTRSVCIFSGQLCRSYPPQI